MKLHVRRQGRVCTVFFDNDRPVPIESFEDAPVGAFPFTMSEPELRSKFRDAEFVFYDEPKPTPALNEPVKEVAPEMLAAKMREFGVVVPVTGLPIPVKLPAPPNPPGPTGAPASPSADVQQLRTHLIAEFAALAADRKLKRDAEAVGSFLINAFPELEPELRAAATRAQERRRFKL